MVGDDGGYGLTQYLARPDGGELTEPGDPLDPMTAWNRMFSQMTGAEAPAFGEPSLTLKDKLDVFFNALVMDLETERGYCANEKSLRYLNDRFDYADAAASNKKRIRLKANGEVDEAYLDGSSARMGFGFGLECQAIDTSAGYFTAATYDRSERNFILRPVDRGKGRTMLGKALSRWLEYYLRDAGERTVGSDRFYSVSKMGTAPIRMKVVSELEYVNDGGGVIREQRAKPKMKVWNWRARDFLITNIARQSALEQEGVMWIDRCTNIYKLEKNEATFDFHRNPDGVPIGFRRTGGEYFNLNRVRAIRPMSKQGSVTAAAVNMAATESTDLRPYNAVSNVALFDTVSYEGPISKWVWDYFEPDMATLFGLDVGLDPLDPTDPAYDDYLAEFRARLGRYCHWEVTYISPGGPNAINYSMVIQFNLSWTNQNSLYRNVFGPEEHEFYGNSISDLGGPIAKVRDMLINAYTRLARFNSDPAILVDESVMKRPEMQKIRDMLRPGSILQKNQNRHLSEMIEIMELREPGSVKDLIMLSEKAFFDCIGVLPAIQGRADDPTLGQSQINVANAQNRMDSRLAPMWMEDYRRYKDFMRYMWIVLGKDAFMEDVREKAGDDAKYIEEEINDLDDVWKMFYFDHPLSGGMNAQQIVNNLLLTAPLALPGGAVDPRKFWETVYQYIYPHYEDFMSPGDPDTIEEEQREMYAGEWVVPDPKLVSEDPSGMQLVMHATAMSALMTELESGVNPIVIAGQQIMMDDPHASNLYQKLHYYLERATEAMGALQAAQMAQAQSGAQGGSQPAPAGMPGLAAPGGSRPVSGMKPIAMPSGASQGPTRPPLHSPPPPPGATNSPMKMAA